MYASNQADKDIKTETATMTIEQENSAAAAATTHVKVRKGVLVQHGQWASFSTHPVQYIAVGSSKRCFAFEKGCLCQPT